MKTAAAAVIADEMIQISNLPGNENARVTLNHALDYLKIRPSNLYDPYPTNVSLFKQDRVLYALSVERYGTFKRSTFLDGAELRSALVTALAAESFEVPPNPWMAGGWGIVEQRLLAAK